METPALSHPNPATKEYYSSSSGSVDTSRPFRSVREAVAIFGERILVGEIFSPKPNDYYCYSTPPPPHREETTNPWRFLSPTPPHGYKSPNYKQDHDHEQNDQQIFGTLKRLETELEETKAELKLLKNRESETEIALASLNAELHKNMSKLAEAEAAAAKKAAETSMKTVVSYDHEREKQQEEYLRKEEDRRRELMIRMENSPTLAQILSLGDAENKGYFRGKNCKEIRKAIKKKPIVPLLGDLFFKKKGSSNILYASPGLYFN